jgi:bromodomain-containing factor 1
MMEAEPQGLNGVHHDDDYSMTALQSRSPSNIGSAGMEVDQAAHETPFETTSAMAASPDMMVDRPTTSNTPVESPRDDDGMPPPAKRARKHSDADQASLAHVRIFLFPFRHCYIYFDPQSSMHQSTSPPPVTTATTTFTNGTSTPVPQSFSELPASTQPMPPSTLSTAQFRFAQSTVRTLKKLKDAVPFLRPVDPVALNIPHYPTIIKTPMDFSTVERKLNSSNPAKPDLNLLNPRYLSADAFISDVRLIFQNCLAFNGPDHAVTLMGKRVEEVFDKQLKQMPPTLEVSNICGLFIFHPPYHYHTAQTFPRQEGHTSTTGPTATSSRCPKEAASSTPLDVYTRHPTFRD